MAVSVRAREDVDLDACVAVLKEVHQNEGYPRGAVDFKKFIANEEIPAAWVAELDQQIVGHIAIGRATNEELSVRVWEEAHPDGEYQLAILSRLFVLPKARKEGVASALIDAATRSCREKGLQLVLFVLVANQAAIRLYERLGWTEYGRSTFDYDGGKSMEAICYAGPPPNIFR